MPESRDELETQATSELPTGSRAIRGSFLSRVAFRFALTYLALYCYFGLD
jgi:hypothetical protein